MDLRPMSKLDPAIGRGNSNVQLPSIGQGQRDRVSSTYEKKPYFSNFERSRVYEHQQRPYNIISYCPKDNKNNKLRNYPKLTLENRLIERDAYHNFDKEPL